MLVIGGNDYYDITSSFGVDKSIVLRRHSDDANPSFATQQDLGFKSGFEYPYSKIASVFTCGMILFCGKAYPFIRTGQYDNTIYGGTHFKPEKDCTCPKFTTFHTYYNYHDAVKYNPWTIKTEWSPYKYNKGSTVADKMKEWFDKNTMSDRVASTFLIEHEASYAVVYRNDKKQGKINYDVWKNPAALKNFNFMSVKDPFTAYMDIMNWQGGVLTENRETLTLSDESKIVKAGFDKKISFRKQKVTA